ncbi:hypothetical protein GJ496_003331 [Pomphorhynchus laevis]|nr:hypothetical protein GJ496_003331 [Pomphorhynchus laevis]
MKKNRIIRKCRERPNSNAAYIIEGSPESFELSRKTNAWNGWTIPQCFQCQKCDHFSSMSKKATHKCVYCSGDHRSVECETKYEKHCTNCHQNHKAFGHTPSQPHKTYAQAIYSQTSQHHDTNNDIKKQFSVQNQITEIDLDKVKNRASHEDSKTLDMAANSNV